MAGKLSATAQQELDTIVQARRKLDRIHNLVEQFATATKGQDQFAGMIARAGIELGRLLLGAGLGVMADQASQLGMLARRGGTTPTKIRGLRDYVAAIRPALDRAERAVLAREAQQPGEGPG